MGTKSLSAADICKIIKVCKDNSVTEFTYESIAIKFQDRSNDLASTQGHESDFAPSVVSEISPQIQKDADDYDKAQQLEAEQAQLLIDDPYAFEQLQMDQDIERTRELN